MRIYTDDENPVITISPKAIRVNLPKKSLQKSKTRLANYCLNMSMKTIFIERLI